MKRHWLAGAFVLAGAALSGCAGGGMYYAAYAPPATRYVAVGVAPGPGYVWTAGFWDWRGGRWGWVEGRWMRPPRPGAVWVAHEWRHEGGRYRFYRGHWR
jgi:hypothetical protein